MILCVTGPMAAGKNAAAAILEKKGFAAVDADELVHQALADSAFQQHVIQTFAEDAAKQHIILLKKDGSLDRRALGALIFEDKKLLAKQEALVHPEADRLINEFISLHPDQNIVLNATVLYKVPSIEKCIAIIYIDAPLITRFFRAKQRDGITTIQILQRFFSQRKLFAKYRAANADIYRVTNTGNLKALEQKIDAVLRRISH
jgi:dephospho-CoA kinase